MYSFSHFLGNLPVAVVLVAHQAVSVAHQVVHPAVSVPAHLVLAAVAAARPAVSVPARPALVHPAAVLNLQCLGIMLGS